MIFDKLLFAMRQVLVAIPCDYDPELSLERSIKGSILCALEQNTYDEVILLELKPWKLNVVSTQQFIKAKFPHVQIKVFSLPIEHIASYAENWNALNGLQNLLIEQGSPHDCSYEILLPPTLYTCLFDCYLLLLLTWKIPYRMLHIDLPLEPLRSLQNPNVMAFNDCVIDKHPTCLSKAQLTYVYGILDKEPAFSLAVPTEQQQNALKGTITTYLSARNKVPQSIACADLPDSISDSLLWGYQTKINKASINRPGLLNKCNATHYSFFGFDSLTSKTQSAIVSYLSRTQRNFALLGAKNNPLLPIKAFELPSC